MNIYDFIKLTGILSLVFFVFTFLVGARIIKLSILFHKIFAIISFCFGVLHIILILTY